MIRRIGQRVAAAARRPGRGRALRGLGAAVLFAGLLVAGDWHPERPPSWALAERVRTTSAVCDARLAERATAPFSLPDDHGAPERLAAIARWFHLDPGAVCAANEVPAGECGGRTVAPGETVVLPLVRGVAEER